MNRIVTHMQKIVLITVFYSSYRSTDRQTDKFHAHENIPPTTNKLWVVGIIIAYLLSAFIFGGSLKRFNIVIATYATINTIW